jgi:hypothetical protein
MEMNGHRHAVARGSTRLNNPRKTSNFDPLKRQPVLWTRQVRNVLTVALAFGDESVRRERVDAL